MTDEHPEQGVNARISPTEAAISRYRDPATLLDHNAALAFILSEVAAVRDVEELPLSVALGRVLASDVSSRSAVPRFNNAAMDGFAIHSADLDCEEPVRLHITGRITPGDDKAALIRPGSVARITTGSPVPAEVGAVIATERVSDCGDYIFVPHLPRPGTNIRRRGEDVRDGDVIVTAGTVIDARHIALVAAAGGSRVAVHRKLCVSVISTGSELCGIGDAPAQHQIIDSNRPALFALLDSAAIKRADCGIVADRPEMLRRALVAAASRSDLIITSGGVSGSSTDHLASAILAAGGRAHTLRLALKPGKPLLWGMLGEVHILGLAGNPVSAMVQFLLFCRPLIRALLGASTRPLPPLLARTSCEFPHQAGRVEFVPVRVVDLDHDGAARVVRLGSGGSASLSPLAAADGFAKIDRMAQDLPEGSVVGFHPFSTMFEV